MFVDDGNDEKPSNDARNDEKSRSCYEQSGSKSPFCLATFWTHMQHTSVHWHIQPCVWQSFVANSNISVIQEGFEVPPSIEVPPNNRLLQIPQKSSSLCTYQTTNNFCTINDEQNLRYFFTFIIC